MPPAVSVVVLAFGAEPYLSDCVEAVLASDADLELVVVDNGAAEAVAKLPEDERLTVLRPDANTGFAGGCNAGAEAARGDVLVFVNSDAILEPGAVAALVTELENPAVGIVCGRVLLASDPTRINTVGNPVHFTGLSWAGGYGDLASDHEVGTSVASFTGALFATRRTTWQALGGFDPAYFAYHEDVELSLRTWLRGLQVRYVPTAQTVHHYEFSRNANKLYLLERNRLATVLTTYPRPVLVRLLPALLLFEALMCATALAQGWLKGKLRGYVWLARRSGSLRTRRREVQASSVITPQAFVSLLDAHLRPPNLEARPPGLGAVDALLSAYFTRVIRTISRA